MMLYLWIFPVRNMKEAVDYTGREDKQVDLSFLGYS